jgi:virginiamycin B lyase
MLSAPEAPRVRAMRSLAPSRSMSAPRRWRRLPARPGAAGSATLGLVAWALLSFASAAGAAPAITEYPATPTDANLVQPQQLAIGPDGNVWYTDANGGGVYRMIASGPSVGRSTEVSPATPSMGATGIVSDGGALWFTNYNGGLGCVTPSGSVSADLATPPGTPSSDGIAVDAEGNLWFTDVGNNRIGEATPSPAAACTLSGSIREYAVPAGVVLGQTSGGNPQTAADSIVALGADVFFTEPGSNSIGEMTSTGSYVATLPRGGQPALYGDPYGITKGPDGNLWFTEMGAGGFGRLNPASGMITQYQPPSISGSAQSWSIVDGPDGNLWFTYGAGSPKAGVGCLSTAGTIAQYPAPTQGANPDGIAVGTDGAIWFAELTTGKIARLYPATCAAGHATGGPPPAPVRPSAPVRPCSTAQLHLGSVRILGAAGHIIWDLALRNTGRRTCKLRGYPRVRLLNARSRPTVSARAAHGFALRTVTLAHGRRAFFTVSLAAAGPCLPHSFTAHGLQIRLPGARGTLRLRHRPLALCSVALGGHPRVTPVRSTLNAS